MTSKLLILLGAAALPLGACSTMENDRTLSTAATGAALGAAGGAGVAAIAGGDLLTGALIGGAVGGLAGAIWADRDGDGRADGYVQNGQYYAGTPGSSSYQSTTSTRRCPSTLGSAATGAAIGGAAGAGVGAAASGVGILEGAVVGAAVGGLAGAIWADSNNDGCVDGYYREGQYYSGAPMAQPAPASRMSGERG